MGHMRHHAILVTSYRDQTIEDLSFWLNERGIAHTVGQPQTNNAITLTVVPDGSKEGWEASAEGDQNREDFIRKISDPMVYCDWAEIVFGDDDPEITRAAVLRCSDFGGRDE